MSEEASKVQQDNRRIQKDADFNTRQREKNDRKNATKKQQKKDEKDREKYAKHTTLEAFTRIIPNNDLFQQDAKKRREQVDWIVPNDEEPTRPPKRAGIMEINKMVKQKQLSQQKVVNKSLEAEVPIIDLEQEEQRQKNPTKRGGILSSLLEIPKGECIRNEVMIKKKIQLHMIKKKDDF